MIHGNILDMFSPEDLTDKSQGKNANERLAPRYRRSYSASPVNILIRAEESDHLRNLTVNLRDFLRENMNMAQYGFLHKLLGKNWSERLRLPLEFRDMACEEFMVFINERLGEIQEKVEILREHYDNTGFDGRSVPIQEFIQVPFNMASRDKILKTYEDVRQGKTSRYPYAFFHPRNTRVPKILTRHLVDDILGLPHTESLPDKLRPSHFSEYQLGGMLGQYFRGNIERALQHAYSLEEFPQLYRRGYQTRDVLHEVFQGLNNKLREKKNE